MESCLYERFLLLHEWLFSPSLEKLSASTSSYSPFLSPYTSKMMWRQTRRDTGAQYQRQSYLLLSDYFFLCIAVWPLSLHAPHTSLAAPLLCCATPRNKMYVDGKMYKQWYQTHYQQCRICRMGVAETSNPR